MTRLRVIFGLLAAFLLAAGPAQAEQQPVLFGIGEPAPTSFDKLNHNDAELYASVARLTTAIAGKAELVHGHTIADVAGLSAALAGKATPADVAAAVSTLRGGVPTAGDTLAKLYNLVSTLTPGGLGAYTKGETDTLLATRAPLAHSHPMSDVTGLAAALAAKQDVATLGGAALLNVGTAPGTVAAGNDSRITGALQPSGNLAGLASVSAARTNLGLGAAAALNVGTVAGTVAAGDDSRITGALQPSGNLAGLASVATAQSNLGLGSIATQGAGAVAITGGTVNGTAIGGTVPAAGAFTSLSATSLALATPLSAAQGGTGYTGVSAALDALFSSAQGAVLYRGASAWQALAPGSAGYVLSSGGTGAAPSWVAQAAGSAVLPLGQVRLTYSLPTAVLVKPYNGNQITVAGAYQTVPSGGVTCANTGLTASTLYYAYLYVSGSTLTCELSTTGHATGTNGLEIKSGDATRTLVGMVLTGAGTPGVFQDAPTTRHVASWFNRRARDLYASAAQVSTSATSATELSAANRTTFVSWSDAAVTQNITGTTSNSTGAVNNYTMLLIDGANVGQFVQIYVYGANFNLPLSLSLATTQAEGFHYFGFKSWVDGTSTGTWNAAVTGTVWQ